MKKAIFLGFLAVSLMIPATVTIVGAQDAAEMVHSGTPPVINETPNEVTWSFLQYFTIAPCRAHDYRTSIGRVSGYVSHNSHFYCPAISSQAKAYMVNIASTGAVGTGYVNAYAYGDPRPSASVLNYGVIPGLNAICNASIVPVNPAYTYEWSVYIYRATYLVCDVLGYFF